MLELFRVPVQKLWANEDMKLSDVKEVGYSIDFFVKES